MDQPESVDQPECQSRWRVAVMADDGEVGGGA